MSSSACPNMASCRMYKVFEHAGALRVWQEKYCSSSEHTKCARFQQTCSGASIPDTLLPNGKLLGKTG